MKKLIFLIFILFACSQDNNITPSYKVGDKILGGVVFYIFKAGDQYYVKNETHGLISSDKNIMSIWGCSAVVTADISLNIGGGYLSTEKIANKCSTSAATECYNLVYNGYNDWFLPNIVEMSEIYNNKAIIPNFNSGEYWTCSIGKSLNVITGYYSNYGINQIKLVRPIRKF